MSYHYHKAIPLAEDNASGIALTKRRSVAGKLVVAEGGGWASDYWFATGGRAGAAVFYFTMGA
jgi:hypothetical protein